MNIEDICRATGRTWVPVSIWSFVGKGLLLSTIRFSKFSRRISFRIVLPVALHTSSILTKFHLFQNSLAGVTGSSWVPVSKWSFVGKVTPFLRYFTQIALRISFKRFLLVGLYTPSIPTKFHLFENSLAG